MFSVLLFILFAGLALGCAISLVVQRNPLYCAISLVGVFVALAGLYILLAAPFIAAVQVIVYAGAIMVLVVFVIMLLNVEEEEHRPSNLRYILIGVALGAILFGEAAFVLYSVHTPLTVQGNTGIGLTSSIGTGLFTEYLLPFEVTSVLILMAIVGAMSLARRAASTNLSARREAGGDGGSTLAQTPLRLTGDARTDAAIMPGETAATGRAMAELQIERGEAAAPSREKE
ncbi:MAG TPA: NADH-quinone oxidoreductase subunit J [Pyrinomonadaceae bacterium]|jgi:NADH-quinone oxidoreductase subunit J|nr:NADH-quinone oxidoreductase subunit J [Pyrinomonadaceae bacterium]